MRPPPDRHRDRGARGERGGASRCSVLLAIFVLSGAAAQPPASLQPDSARDCAVCHLEWVASFRRPPQAVRLMDPPGANTVSEATTCLGCHDGSVGDSRRQVWSGHNHTTGTKPPAGMAIPPQLPLENGQLACRTCHTAHAGQASETLATAVFIRMPNESGQLCQSCHPEKAKGPELGTHPVGGMPWPVPAALLAAGAKPGRDPQRLVCQTCHTPHGAPEEHLLVMGTQSSQLCLTCHSKLRPGLWRPDAPREHPQNPRLDSTQQEAVKALGTRMGLDSGLICLSCHKLHHGLAGRNMLADTLHNSDLCLRCHPSRADMVKTRHDLRTSAPSERNRLGQIPEESGPCGACHSFHQFGRRPDPQPLDPTGLCATCHRQGGCAGQATGLPFSHPTDIRQAVKPGGLDLPFYLRPDDPAVKTAACLTCHNPHQVSQRHFLRGDSSSLCGTCHREKAASIGNGHDFTLYADFVNGRNETGGQVGKCGFCHGVHNAIGPEMWVATSHAPQKPDDWCVECHSPTGMARAAKMTPLRHPTGPTATMPAMAGSIPASAPSLTPEPPRGVALPLFDDHGRRSLTGSVACASCHDPHGGASHARDMLRLPQHGGDTGLCGACHVEAVAIQATLHNECALGERFADAPSCAPCHAVHEKPGMSPTGMWAARPGPQTEPPADRLCMGCHSPGGSGTTITPTAHPAVPMVNISEPGGPGWMPLYDAEGKAGSAGTIGCGTCHLPHGPLNGPMAPVDPATASTGELRSLRTMVRPYVAPTVCNACHGFDGLRRYLYFHDPARRHALPEKAPP